LNNISTRILHKARAGKEANEAILKFLKEASYSDLTYANSLKNQLIYLPHSGPKRAEQSLGKGLAAIYDF
jgi:hypothetical protein